MLGAKVDMLCFLIILDNMYLIRAYNIAYLYEPSHI